MEHQSREIEKVLQSSKLCGYVLATLLEELPVVETLEFAEALKKDLGVSSEIITNKVMDPPLTEAELKQAADSNFEGLSDFAKHLSAVLERQRIYRKELEKSGAQVASVPLIFSSVPKEVVDQAVLALRQGSVISNR
jgi:hypothetical protein